MKAKLAAGPRINLLESDEQANGVAYLRRVGWKVWVSSERRRTSTSGQPDVVGLHPAFGCLFWEAKSATGTLSEKQRAFGAACRESGTPWCYGTMADLLAYLKTLKAIG